MNWIRYSVGSKNLPLSIGAPIVIISVLVAGVGIPAVGFAGAGRLITTRLMGGRVTKL